MRGRSGLNVCVWKTECVGSGWIERAWDGHERGVKMADQACPYSKWHFGLRGMERKKKTAVQTKHSRTHSSVSFRLLKKAWGSLITCSCFVFFSKENYTNWCKSINLSCPCWHLCLLMLLKCRQRELPQKNHYTSCPKSSDFCPVLQFWLGGGIDFAVHGFWAQ